jgi:hypothetical protein
MNIYYTNPFYDKLPNEIQNHICSFLPPHPIKKIIQKLYYKVGLYGYRCGNWQLLINYLKQNKCNICVECKEIIIILKTEHKKNKCESCLKWEYILNPANKEKVILEGRRETARIYSYI